MHSIPRFIYTFFLASMLAGIAMLPVFTQAQGMGGAGRPLVVVRFNQPRVYYDQQLYDAIAQAVAIKPDVMFDVVSFAPATGDSDNDSKWQETAGHHTQLVVSSMQNIGIPLARIRITGQTQPGIRYDETQVFVH
jgi:hypothetical protein